MEVIATVHYEKRGQIGSEDGQNSCVFRAFDHHLHAELAVKEVAKARIGDPLRYFNEARAVHASAHPRVVPIRWAAETADHVCIAMPVMAGGSLAEAIRRKPICASEAIRIGEDLCEGVAQVHLAGYVHLDVKPSNVLFDAGRRAAVTDFGLAVQLDALGTADARDQALYPSFLPPEYIRARGVMTPASDVYQIGLTLYRAVNGEPFFAAQWAEFQALPFRDRREAISDGRFPNRESFLPGIPLGLRQAIARALSLEPARRQVGARQLGEELASVQVKHDWEVDDYSPDSIVWRLRTLDRADLLIILRGVLPSATIEVWTETSAGRRRKSPESWAAGVRTQEKLRKALNRAFRAAMS